MSYKPFDIGVLVQKNSLQITMVGKSLQFLLTFLTASTE